MKGRIVRRQLIPRPLAEVSAFFEDPYNLQRITPRWLAFRITAAPGAGLARGSHLRYRLRLWGIPIGWRTEILRFDHGWGFVDSQERGPYHSWIHTHTFVPVDGGVLMEDRVDYELPLGRLGAPAAPVVAAQVRAIFDHRRARVESILGPHEGVGEIARPGDAAPPPSR